MIVKILMGATGYFFSPESGSVSFSLDARDEIGLLISENCSFGKACVLLDNELCEFDFKDVVLIK